ncbi:MAG TPA: twin-arginine translocase TatA/TatE family subunit [Alphaproteobacteria bacterium]|jgi:sec-independent protein translocase protein TatA|nr:twin-arginine translocase TatA/TatE family subunit [Alphaproteobacteria bacterium]MDP7428661.1 twin-arginine translocase TatA/TatE family subunit [Alphaproteobacteria bacterium]HJM51580.1 twin-arginine translocase TatA/TatE family subunit [Alphaproteobacteria bacterium]|tara:strand:+ start:1149 stop:1385 length:237 start_codon:yes stop_codon:yes gene_type:complete
MGFTSIWHWLIVLAVVLILFGGRGKISAIMGDFGKGLRAFKKGIKEGETEVAEGDAKAIEANASAAVENDSKDQAAKT